MIKILTFAIVLTGSTVIGMIIYCIKEWMRDGGSFGGRYDVEDEDK